MEGSERLPRGRHRLSRYEVSASQRQRLLRAMAEAVAELGYANTPVAEVISRAGVSRETFYEQFANKEECFLAAYDLSVTLMLEAVGEAATAPPAPVGAGERLDLLLGRYLAMLADEPAIARTFLVEVYAAGPNALARRVEVQHRFVRFIASLAGAADERQHFACEAIVGAITALVTQRVCVGAYDELETLHAPVVGFIRDTLASVDLS